MDSSNKNTEKTRNTTQNTSYNPWNLLFSPRSRSESESSVNSTTQNCQSGPQFGGLQRQTSKNEEYLWMIASSSLSMGSLRRRSHHSGRHSTTIRRTANMAGSLLSIRLLGVLLAITAAEPAPGRVPKVYNALITSNQNLEPSKAYPVYQPVLHDSFAFSIQPVLYGGEYPINNGLLPVPAQPPKEDQNPQSPPEVSSPSPPTEAPATDAPATTEPASADPQSGGDSTTAAPPLPPNTESPIPLNEFGLPAQVLPLGRINPAFTGFTQLGPFAYSYPGLRYYDPFDPFTLGHYGFPLYRPLPNVLGPSIPLVPVKPPASVPQVPAEQPAQSPPSEPSDLNVLNYSSKDPAIPNVPPPPLPQGGLKTDKSE